MKSKKTVVPEVAPALDADMAAKLAYEHDKSLTTHHFVKGEHPMVRIEHLNKAFDDNVVLRDVNLNVWPGEVVVVLGPSGSGKSTMLRCINRLETPTAGHILFKDQAITDAHKKDLCDLRKHLGMVFQNFNLFPHYSVLKNVMDAPVRVLKTPKEQAEKEARALLEQFGLADKADSYPDQLSGGQQQRVSVARALALRPEILFLDEPTSALDPELTADVLKVLRQLADEHMTMIIVTHELGFAREVSDRIIFMEGGHIIEQGTPEELFSSDKQRVKEFIGKLSSN